LCPARSKLAGVRGLFENPIKKAQNAEANHRQGEHREEFAGFAIS